MNEFFLPWITWRFTYAGSKFAGRQAYFPEWAGVGFWMETVDIALPSATSLLVTIDIPPRDKATSRVSSLGEIVFGTGKKVVPPFWRNFGCGVGETKSPVIWKMIRLLGWVLISAELSSAFAYFST